MPSLASCFCFSSRRRHAMSKRDWSSDVCSSDLASASRPSQRRLGELDEAESLRRVHLPGRRSEERRVGKECRFRWSLHHLKQKIGSSSVIPERSASLSRLRRLARFARVKLPLVT